MMLSNKVQEKQKVGNYSAYFRPPIKAAGISSFLYIEKQINQDQEIYNLWQHMGNILGDMDEVVPMLYYRNKESRPIVPYLFQLWEQSPNPQSRLTLSTERDKLGLRKIDLDWRLSEIDHLTMRIGQETLACEFGKLGIGRLRVDTSDISEMPDKVQGDNHQMGTTRMHNSPDYGVVDADCKLHYIDNLYISGGSVFPTAGSSTPTLTIVALSLRLAHHLRQKLS
jgi:choline dehydrogenase-like flavoprotein